MAFDLSGKAIQQLELRTVDYGGRIPIVVMAKEGDANSRCVLVTLRDARGVIALRNYQKATLYATLPDGSIQYSEGEISAQNNTSVCVITSSMLTQIGKVSCDLMLTGVDMDGQHVSLTSETFYIQVAAAQAGDTAIKGDNQYPLITTLVTMAQNASQQAQEAVEHIDEKKVEIVNEVVDAVLADYEAYLDSLIAAQEATITQMSELVGD